MLFQLQKNIPSILLLSGLSPPSLKSLGRDVVPSSFVIWDFLFLEMDNNHGQMDWCEDTGLVKLELPILSQKIPTLTMFAFGAGSLLKVHGE